MTKMAELKSEFIYGRLSAEPAGGLAGPALFL